MRSNDIIRAWKDATYRKHLSVEDQELVPEHPAGSLDLFDDELDEVVGATGTWVQTCNHLCWSPFCVPSFQAICPINY